ncbi:MAG TPA: riboflavin synthase, partial [Rhodoblastus sp.]|nr:riboflavin synthase [Rhodoblastus sp.]
MFTGLISDVGTLLSVEPRGDLKRLRLASHYPYESLTMGASVAHNGVCMTLVGFGPRDAGDGFASWHEVDAAAETLAVTTADAWAPGEKINLERALKIGDELGGHLVSGHVD